MIESHDLLDRYPIQCNEKKGKIEANGFFLHVEGMVTGDSGTESVNICFGILVIRFPLLFRKFVSQPLKMFFFKDKRKDTLIR